VTVTDATPPELLPASLDLRALEGKMRAQLVGTGLFAAGDAGTGPVARARITIASEAVEVGAKGEARARVRMRVDTRPPDQPGAVSFDVDGNGVERYEVTKPAPDHAALFTRLVLRIAADLSNDVAARRRLHTGSAQAVHEALMADGGELRQEAIRVVADRKLREEAPALLKLLGDNDEPTRDAALGALIVLRDRRAVTELTRTRSLRDRREMRKILEAIAMIGGEEAEQYLSFVAATHDDEEIRMVADKARARLARSAADAMPTK
jgi:HEAT repeat protein